MPKLHIFLDLKTKTKERSFSQDLHEKRQYIINRKNKINKYKSIAKKNK